MAITWRVAKYSEKVSKKDTDRDLAAAFQVWEEVSALHFTHLEDGKVTIKIEWVPSHHGDGHPFDGKDGTLAHAFYPSSGGDTHFEEVEKWTVNKQEGLNNILF